MSEQSEVSEYPEPPSQQNNSAKQPSVGSTGGDESLRSVVIKAATGGAIAAGAIAVVGGIIGVIAAGMPGLIGALIGAVVSCLFFAITAIVLGVTANKSPVYMAGMLLGSWLIKIILFIVVLTVLKGQTFYNQYVLYFCLVAGVIATLAIDVLVVRKSRISYVQPR